MGILRGVTRYRAAIITVSGAALVGVSVHQLFGLWWAALVVGVAAVALGLSMEV